MYTKTLPQAVPLYGQENGSYCGHACVQMARNGYPNSAGLYFTQQYISTIIPVYMSRDATDIAQVWPADPHGLTGCLQSLNNPAGVNWVQFCNADREVVLFDILYWMNRREYPSPVLINAGQHWVLIVEFTTNVEPVSGSRPTLQTIKYHDPLPIGIGQVTLQSGADWVGTPAASAPWQQPVLYPGTWENQYVAVVEPPQVKGRVRVKAAPPPGDKLLTPDEAIAQARRWIAEMELDKQPEFSVLGHKGIVPLEPLPVIDAPRLGRTERRSKRSRVDPHYYVVPFGLASEFGEHGGRPARACVLVDAHSGRFEQVTAFGKPVRYLAKKEALEIVSAALQIEPGKLEAEATLVFQPSALTQSRSWPFWRVKAGNRTLYVDQWGKLYGQILPSHPGD